jgi:hypothetical protein
MTVVDVYAGSRTAKVMTETWGHLRAQDGRQYTGVIVFAHSAYGGESMPISVEIPDLDDSPWFYQALCEFVEDHYGEDTAGKVFRWTGTYEQRTHPEVRDDQGLIVTESWDEHLFTGDIIRVPVG